MKEKVTIKKWQIIFFVILIVCSVGLWLWQSHWPRALIKVNGEELNVLLADTPYHYYVGLGGRNSWGNFAGMLFVFPDSSQHGIVMRNMNFPIDIVWLDHGRIIDFAQNVPIEPGVKDGDLVVYYPRVNGNLVLELPAGWVLKNGLKIGDILTMISR